MYVKQGGFVWGVYLQTWVQFNSTYYKFAFEFSYIGDFFLHIFDIHSFCATATLLNNYVNKPMHAIRCVGQCDANIPSLSPSGSRSKAVANDYRHEYQHGCGLWPLVILIVCDRECNTTTTTW